MFISVTDACNPATIIRVSRASIVATSRIEKTRRDTVGIQVL